MSTFARCFPGSATPRHTATEDTVVVAVRSAAGADMHQPVKENISNSKTTSRQRSKDVGPVAQRPVVLSVVCVLGVPI
jgi:hypothetical protein